MMIDHQLIHSVLNWVETVALELQLKQLSSIHIYIVCNHNKLFNIKFLYSIKKIVAVSVVMNEGLHDVNKLDFMG